MIYRGETIRIRAEIKDFNGQPLTPDSHEVTIYDPNGEVRATITEVTQEDAGIFHVDYTIPDDAPTGMWRVIWKATRGTQISIETVRFSVSSL